MHCPHLFINPLEKKTHLLITPLPGDVFVMGLKADQKHHLYRVNPSTGNLKYLAECGFINVLGGAHAFSPITNEVWLQYGVNSSTGDIHLDFFAFDATTGNRTKHVCWLYFEGGGRGGSGLKDLE